MMAVIPGSELALAICNSSSKSERPVARACLFRAGFGDQSFVVNADRQGDGAAECADGGEQLIGGTRLAMRGGGFLRMLVPEFIPRLPDDGDG